MLINVITPTLSLNDFLHASIDSVKNQKNLNTMIIKLHQYYLHLLPNGVDIVIIFYLHSKN